MSQTNTSIGGPGWVLELSVFVCGAVVMIFEIIGSRVVAPSIGTSTYTWTSLIGVILAAISLGYWVGGRMADRQPNVRILGTAIFFAGGSIGLMILIKGMVLGLIVGLPVGLEIQSVLSAVLLFAPASVALGFVIPYATKLRIPDLADSGKTVGRLYALSTIGSIVGTFGAGFFLIPFVGSIRTLYLLTATLFVLSTLLIGISFTRIKIALLVIFILGIAVSEGSTYLMFRMNNTYDIDTEYSRAMVFKMRDARSGRIMQALSTDPIYVQSGRFLDGDDLALDYSHYYDLVAYYKPNFEKALMIGGAGFSYPQSYVKIFPDAEIEVVEIDPGMTKIARRFFGLTDHPRMKIVHSDGRVFLNAAPDETYDAVLMDAFGSLFSVPFQLTTVEAVREIERTLKPGGVVILNIGSAIRGPSSRFLQAEYATYRSVFPEIHLYKVRQDHTDERLQNLIIVACKNGCITNTDPIRSDLESLLSHRYTDDLPLDEPFLTDDLAPVERYASIANAERSR
jgi:spermidine synthase/MFS family permease